MPRCRTAARTAAAILHHRHSHAPRRRRDVAGKAPELRRAHAHDERDARGARRRLQGAGQFARKWHFRRSREPSGSRCTPTPLGSSCSPTCRSTTRTTSSSEASGRLPDLGRRPARGRRAPRRRRASRSRTRRAPVTVNYWTRDTAGTLVPFDTPGVRPAVEYRRAAGRPGARAPGRRVQGRASGA